MPTTQPLFPPAFTALKDYPALWNAVEPSLMSQGAYIQRTQQTCFMSYQVKAQVAQAMAALEGGLVTIEGPPGSGVSTLLAHLAATQPVAFWFGDHDAAHGRAGYGMAALAAQLIALHKLSLPLIPPSIATDYQSLADLLKEASTQPQRVIVLLDPPSCPLQPLAPFPQTWRLPRAALPPNVLLIAGSLPGADWSFRPDLRIHLPQQGEAFNHAASRFLHQLKCPLEAQKPLIEAAQGNFLYLRLAAGLIHQKAYDYRDLPLGLEQLYQTWWADLSSSSRQLALLLAAAGEPLPYQLCADLLGTDPQPTLELWQALGLADCQSDPNPPSLVTVSLHHWALRDYLARSHPTELEQTHTALTMELAKYLEQEQLQPPSLLENYAWQQFARHAALGLSPSIALPRVAQRAWIRGQERRTGQLAEAARDLSWELRTAIGVRLEPQTSEAQLLRLASITALVGTFTSLTRSLNPEAVADALLGSQERLGREGSLKRTTALVDQLPDGQAKAQVLRQLGETCYGLKQRSAAMRLLSQALDIEEQKIPRVWREQREHLLCVLVKVALALGESEGALALTTQIEQSERRGVAATQVVHWLLAKGAYLQAQKVACAIKHESLAAWAQAEVAVAWVRAGYLVAGEALLAQVKVETARGWGEIELACDSAANDELNARQRLARLENSSQREHGLARLAAALAAANKGQAALTVACEIEAVEVRVMALLDVRQKVHGTVAVAALEQATTAIGALTKEVRVPLLTLLAASYGALGHTKAALQVASQLAPGEEQERAQSRTALALAQSGKYAEGLTLAQTLTDPDERDWTYDELVRVLAAAGAFGEALQLAYQISTLEQKAQTLANLALAQAKAGDPLGGFQLAQKITQPGERARALTHLAPLLVASGQQQTALLALDENPLTPLQTSRYLLALVSALANQGALTLAQSLAPTIPQPLAKAQAYLAIAHALAAQRPKQAYLALGTAFQMASLGRAEAFLLLGQAAPTLAMLGGTSLLIKLAHAIGEFEHW